MADPIEILFVDDEPFFARRYIENLKEAGFVVHYCESADAAAGNLAEHPTIRAIVLDVMMPSPEGVPHMVTGGGLDTGIWLFEELAPRLERDWIPVVVLTNRDVKAVNTRIQKTKFPSELVAVRRKVETPAFYAPQYLKEIIALVDQKRDQR